MSWSDKSWTPSQESGSTASSGRTPVLWSSSRAGSQVSSRTTIEDFPGSHSKVRERVDGTCDLRGRIAGCSDVKLTCFSSGSFVQFLIDYAANDPECPPLFKGYLEEVVLKPLQDEDLALKVEYHLRNPQIRNYRLGTTFVRELAKYAIYDQVFSVRGSKGALLPSAPIPEKYRPKPRAEVHSVIGLETAGPLQVEAQSAGRDGKETLEEREGQNTKVGNDQGEEQRVRRQLLDRLDALEGEGPPGGTTGGPATHLWFAWTSSFSGRAGHESAIDLGGEGRLTELCRQLHSIPTLPTNEQFDARDEITDRSGADWVLDSWYKGKRQPPLAARLETVVKFLAGEDVDRCVDWEAKFASVVAYLGWLAHDDDKHQLRHANPQTRAMFNDAVTKAKAHVLFQKHHCEPTPLEITRPPKAPPRSTRLNWMVNRRDWPLPSRTPVPDQSDLLPRAILPRPPSPVHRMLIDEPGNAATILDAFAEQQRQWWQRISGDDVPPDAADNAAEQDNLAYIESRAFDASSGEGSTGWVRRDPATGLTLLPDETLVVPGDPRSWARERGARRAGLQQMLRALGARGDGGPRGRRDDTRPPRPPLVMPLEAAALRRACEDADGPQWTPPRLARDQLPETLETLPQTVAYRAREARRRRMGELARLRVEDRFRRDRRWATLPRNLPNGGPFVWRMVDPDVQAGQDLLRQCRTVASVLREAHRRVPRPLLRAVLDLMSRAARGEFGRHGVPEGVRLAGDEWEQVGAERSPRHVDSEELQWLKFLAGECVNRKNWTGRFVPDTPREKYRLFLIFATRVQKLLDDKNPHGLFSRHDAKVTVEQLLEAINAGKDSSAVTKCEFHPYDACSWLDRMHRSGHVR